MKTLKGTSIRDVSYPYYRMPKFIEIYTKSCPRILDQGKESESIVDASLSRSCVMYKLYKGLTPNNSGFVIVNPFGRVVYWKQWEEDKWEPVPGGKVRLTIHENKCILLKTMTKDELLLELI